MTLKLKNMKFKSYHKKFDIFLAKTLDESKLTASEIKNKFKLSLINFYISSVSCDENEHLGAPTLGQVELFAFLKTNRNPLAFRKLSR